MEEYDRRTLMDGRVITMIMPRAWDYSRALQKHQKQNEFDLILFFMEELCRFNGEKMKLEFYGNMSCDDYLLLLEMINSVTQRIK
jgi:hypothetical protein